MVMDRVVEISTIKPEWDDVVVIKVDLKNLSHHVKVKYLEDLRNGIKDLFPNNKVAIIGNNTEVNLQKE